MGLQDTEAHRGGKVNQFTTVLTLNEARIYKLDGMSEFVKWLKSQHYPTPLVEAITAAYYVCDDSKNLNEGVVGRTISALSIALSSLLGHAHANIDNLDLKTASEEEINEIKTEFEKLDDIDFCKLKSKGLVCKDTNNSVTIYPTKSLSNLDVPDIVTEVIFLDGYKNPEGISGVVFNYKNGAKKSFTHKIGEKYGYVSVLDEYDTERSKKIMTPAQIEEYTSRLYKNVIKGVDAPNKQDELEQRIIKKYTGKDTKKYQEYNQNQYNNDELYGEQNDKIKSIMAKYQK